MIVCGLLSESIREFFEDFASDPQSTPYSVQETVEKIMGGLRHVAVTRFPSWSAWSNQSNGPTCTPSLWWNPLGKSERRSPPPEGSKSARCPPMPSHSCRLSVATGVWEIAYTGVCDVAFADDQMRLRGLRCKQPGGPQARGPESDLPRTRLWQGEHQVQTVACCNLRSLPGSTHWGSNIISCGCPASLTKSSAICPTPRYQLGFTKDSGLSTNSEERVRV
jgi:hypothetical protein